MTDDLPIRLRTAAGEMRKAVDVLLQIGCDDEELIAGNHRIADLFDEAARAVDALMDTGPRRDHAAVLKRAEDIARLESRVRLNVRSAERHNGVTWDGESCVISMADWAEALRIMRGRS